MDAAATSAKRPIRAGIVLIAVVAAIAALWLAREIVLLGFLGVLIAVVFSFPVNWISRLLPRGVAVIIVLLLLIGAVVGLGLLVAPTLPRGFGELPQRAPKAVRSAAHPLRGSSARCNSASPRRSNRRAITCRARRRVASSSRRRRPRR